MVIHCVPLPKEVGDLAPIYFKKAIMECESEWAQNKKLIDLKNRDVRKAVPKGLPYFFVDFAMTPGYAHVIEDEQQFPSNFAQVSRIRKLIFNVYYFYSTTKLNSTILKFLH